MAGITLTQANTQLAAYIDAETKILAGQSATINGRTLTRANLKEVQDGIRIWDRRARKLDSAFNKKGLEVREVVLP